MSDETEEFLAHYGVRGMKWGVRRNLKKLAPSDRSAYLKEKDAKWLAKVEANPKLAKVSRLTTKYAKKEMKNLKKDYKERGLNIKKSSLARSRYDNEVKVILDQSLEKAAYKTHKLSPSRLNQVEVQRHPDGTMTAKIVARDNPRIAKQFKSINAADKRRQASAKKQAARAERKASKVVHSDTDEVTDEEFEGLEFFMTLDDDGFVDEIISPFGDDDDEEDSLEQAENVDEFLAHYGVVGMKWGVRRMRNRSAKARIAKKQTLERNASEEGREANRILTKQKRFGTGALTNQELQVVNARIRLEQDFAKNFPGPKSTLQMGKEFAKEFVSVVGVAGDTVKSVDKAKKILKGQYLMSEEAKNKAKVAAAKAALGS